MQTARGTWVGRKPNTFFLEMILAIAFLAISSGVLLQLFAGAHIASRQSDDIGKAVLTTQNAVACFKAADAQPGALADILGGWCDGNTVYIGYSDDLTVTGQEPRYRMTISISGDGALSEAQIVFFRDDEALYEISAALYRQEGASHE